MRNLALLLSAGSMLVVLGACGSSDEGGGADVGTGTSASADAGTTTPPSPNGTPDGGTTTPTAPATYAVGGTVTGLVGSVVLQNNGGDDLTVGANGKFTFSKKVASGAKYAVTVKAQPNTPSQTCTVSGGSGTVASGDVTSITVNCAVDKFTVGGTVSGLAGAGLVLQNKAGDDLPVNANGTFAFATTVASGAGYDVSIKTQPTAPHQTCAVASGAGTVGAANVTSVAITCTTNKYVVGGTLSGLEAGKSITLKNNGGDDLTLDANGAFAFATQVASGAAYAVTVGTSPAGQTCAVTSGTGTVAGAAVTAPEVKCSRAAIDGSYATFVAAGEPNTLVVGDIVKEANDYGGYYFKLAAGVAYARVSITGAAGSRSSSNGGSGGTGTVDVSRAFLEAQGKTGFWIIVGQAGRPSAGGNGGTAGYRAFNGGGAGTDWSNGKDAYTYATGGGGGTDLRFEYDGAANDPKTGDPTATFASRFAVVGGGGGSTTNTPAPGGGGGGFNRNGGNGSAWDGYVAGTGGTNAVGGSIGGALGLGGDAPQDGNMGWAGGGGGGYYGGGASPAHFAGGGGSGFLLNAAGLTEVSTADGAQGGNGTTSTHGAFSVTAY